MEEKGIGRPSTYAPTISTITGREYVAKEGKYLKPTSLGEVVTGLMEERFPDIVDLKFTAHMEDRLDEIENGKIDWKNVLEDFYGDFDKELTEAEKALEGVHIKVPDEVSDEVCDKCVERIESGAYDVIILNFANCDMVGHTGVLQAAVKAVETVDECVGRVVEATLKMGGIAMVTADHGNAEVMLQPDGSPMTAHTTNLVPFILCGAGTQLRPGRLADIAPTILDVMGLAAPQEMDGQTLIVK